MSLTITLSDELAHKLQIKAERRHLSPEALALTILADSLAETDEFPTLEEVVAHTKALPPNPASIRPATGSLLEALQNVPDDPDFDLETWTEEWAKIEAEMKAITRANDIVEGRG